MKSIRECFVDGSANKSYRNLPRRALTLGLVGVALIASGCGIAGRENNKTSKPSPAKIEKNVKKILNPAMAKVGRRAVKFAREDDNYHSFWSKSDGRKELSIMGDGFGSAVEVTFRPGFNPKKTKRIHSGDVVKVLINPERDIENPLVKGDKTSARIEVDLSGRDDNSCRHKYSAESDYHFDSENDRHQFSSYTSVDACESSYVGTKVEDIPAEDAAYAVALDMLQALDQELAYIEKTN